MIGTLLIVCIVGSAVASREKFPGFDSAEDEDGELGQRCGESAKCKSPDYRCHYHRCVCNEGYIIGPELKCFKCAGLWEECNGGCCVDDILGVELECYNNVCRHCFDAEGNDKCRTQPTSDLYLSATQFAMGISLVLAIFATFVLLYKLCQKSDSRRANNMRRRVLAQITGRQIAYEDNGGRNSDASITTVQRYVAERLRDAPPRYTRAVRGAPTAPPMATISPQFDNPPDYNQVSGHENYAFTNEVILTPPPYARSTDDNLPAVDDSKEKTQTNETSTNSSRNTDRTNHI